MGNRHKQGHGKERTERFLYFLRNIVHTSDPRENEKYMEEIGTLTRGTIDMNTIELARQHGIEDGIERERKKAEAEKLSIALNFKKSGFPVEVIAKNTGLNIKLVERL